MKQNKGRGYIRIIDEGRNGKKIKPLTTFLFLLHQKGYTVTEKTDKNLLQLYL